MHSETTQPQPDLAVESTLHPKDQLPTATQLFQRVLDTIPQLIFWKDRNSVFLGCNHNAIKIAGLESPEQIIGKTDYDMPWKLEEAEWFRACDRRVMESGVPELHIIEPQQQADGRQAWLDTSKFPLKNENGEVVGILVTIEDITDRVTLDQAKQRFQEDLEEKVVQRTQELQNTIAQLETEIVDRREAEIALDHSEIRFQKLAANVPGMIYQFRLEPDGSFSFPYVSLGCRDLYGIEPGEIEQSAERLIDLIHPDDRQSFFESVMHSAKTLETWKWEGQTLTRSGEIKWIQGSSRPELQPDGAVVWDGLLLDVSDRKCIEDERKQTAKEQSRLVAILEATTDLVSIADGWGNTSYINQAGRRLLNLSQAELDQGFAIGTIIAPSALEQFHQEALSTVLQQGIWSGETLLLSRDGHKIPVSQVMMTHRGEDGEIEFLSIIARDISDYKQAEAALRSSESQLRQQTQDLEFTLSELRKTQSQLIQSEKMSSLGQLVAGVAHEINNPVNFIYGNIAHTAEYAQDLIALLESYQRHYPHPAPALKAEIEAIDLDFLMCDLPKTLASMRIGAERIREIVLSLRTFSRLDQADIKAIDLHESIDSTLMILQSRLKPNSDFPGIQVIKDYGNLPLVECYAGQLNQVFMNILSNAIDALEESFEDSILNKSEDSKAQSPTIRIVTKQVKSNTIIHIVDNGSGMSEEVRSRLFDPFFTTKPVGKGTGLGLSISYQIVVEKHQGELRCQSTLGEGTEFTITIPQIKPKK
jgi:two-component system, NtrC family, sensor kinase